MKNVVNVNEFKTALKKVTAINKKKNEYVPILNEVKFIFTENSCTLVSTNLTQWGIITIPARGDSFSFVSNNIKSIVKASRYFSDDLVFDYDNNKQTIKLSCKGKSCEQACTAVEEYPVEPRIHVENTYQVNAKDLFDRYKKIKYAINKNGNVHPIYTGVCFNENDIVALDGFRLAINTDFNKQLVVDSKFIVPQEAMDLLSIFDKSYIQIEVGNKDIVFKNDNTMIISRLLDGDFLNYRKILYNFFVKETYHVNPKQYINALKYLSEFKTPKDKTPVIFDNGTLSFTNADGTYTAKIDLDMESNIKYGYNPQYMIDALSQFKDCDMVTIQIQDARNAIVISDNKDNVALVLPVRID